MGVVIQGSGGLRKVRWGLRHRGERGGVRVIYYWAIQQERVLMLLIYPKNVQDDLTPAQLKALKQVIEAEFP
jgi:mRNA-degrading endonuclease RelE of RelBE toxin-antitoxin system